MTIIERERKEKSLVMIIQAAQAKTYKKKKHTQKAFQKNFEKKIDQFLKAQVADGQESKWPRRILPKKRSRIQRMVKI